MPMKTKTLPEEIRITDRASIRLVKEEQKRIGDATATRTLARIIDRYFNTPRQIPITGTIENNQVIPAGKS